MTRLVLSEAGQSVVSGTFSRAMKHAGEALASMSGRRVEVQAPELRRCTAGDVITMAGGPEYVVLAIYAAFAGSLRGHALLLFSPLDAHRLARILVSDLRHPQEPSPTSGVLLSFDELELSALQEVGNVTISAFLNEVGMHLHEPISPTPPQVVVEMVGAVLDAVLLDLVGESDQVLAAGTTFSEGGQPIDGTLFVLPRPESLPILLDALGAAGI
jgi:chemotaxis protein CheC